MKFGQSKLSVPQIDRRGCSARPPNFDFALEDCIAPPICQSGRAGELRSPPTGEAIECCRANILRVVHQVCSG